MNTHTTHTPGPWHIGVRQPSSDKFIYGPQGTEVADCDRLTNFPSENLANARLIAAAPDLLAALNYALAILDQPIARRLREENPVFAGDLVSLESNARAAIAKAKGGAA